MRWETGDKLRVINNRGIDGGSILTNGYVYDVVAVDSDDLPVIEPYGDGTYFYFVYREMQFVERVEDTVFTEDYEMSDAELGEPSESPNVTLSEIYEELLDMKAMIGRLIRNGGDEE